MTFLGNQTCEVDAATGNDQNSGWFDPASSGHDLTYGAFQTVITFTDIVMDGSSNVTFTSVANPVQTTWVGNWIRIQAGTTGFTAGMYKINSVTAGSPNKAVLNSTPAPTSTAQSAGVVKMGGSLLTLGQAMVDGNFSGIGGSTIYLKYNPSGVYTTTGGFTMQGGGEAIRGYTTTRDDRSTQPTIQLTATSTTIFSITSFQGTTFENLILDGNNIISSTGISAGEANCLIDTVLLKRFTNTAINCNSGAQAFGATVICNCEITACTTHYAFIGNMGTSCFGMIVHDNTAGGININGAAYSFCAAYNNANDGFVDNGYGGLLNNCIAYNNAATGILGNGTYDSLICVNCISTFNGAYGYDQGGASRGNGMILHNCSGFGNSTALYNNHDVVNDFGAIVLTADPFASASTGNFALNSNAGGGALLKAVAFPSTFAGTTTSNGANTGISQAGSTGGGTVGLGYA